MRKRGPLRTRWIWVVCVMIGWWGLVVVCPSIVLAALHYMLPDTGQTKCYGEGAWPSGEIDCPTSLDEPYYGQDGNYKGRQPSLQDNGDGTVSDLNTGLVWQQSDRATTSWGEALGYCNALSLGGTTGWRLPSILELISITNYGIDNSNIDTVYFYGGNGKTWSGTDIGDDGARILDFNGGFALYQPKDNTAAYVRCVRDGP